MERLATIVDVNDETVIVNKFAIKQDLNISFARQQMRTKMSFFMMNTWNTGTLCVIDNRHCKIADV
jgi:hypothetical protein